MSRPNLDKVSDIERENTKKVQQFNDKPSYVSSRKFH